MKIINVNDKSINKYTVFMLFLLSLSLLFQNFYFDIGFAVKPFMIVLLFIIFIYFIKPCSIIKKNFLHEQIFMLFIIYNFIRGGFSVDKLSCLRLLLGIIIILALYVFATNLVYKVDIDIIKKILLISNTIFLAISLLLYYNILNIGIAGGIIDRSIYRLTGTVNDPNFFVLFATIIYGITFKEVLNKKTVCIIPLILCMVCIFLTFSRGGYLGIGLLTLLIMIDCNCFKLKNLIYFFCLFGILFLLVIFINNYIDIDVNNYLNINIHSIIQSRLSDSTGSGRIYIWGNALELFKRNPFFGIGLYNFKYYNTLYYNDTHYAHNTFLEILVEGGTIGFFLFSCFSISFIYFIFKKSKSDFLRLVKSIILAQLVMLVFLSGYINEILYFTVALHKGIVLKMEEG